jgi:hypothetical protein
VRSTLVGSIILVGGLAMAAACAEPVVTDASARSTATTNDSRAVTTSAGRPSRNEPCPF